VLSLGGSIKLPKSAVITLAEEEAALTSGDGWLSVHLARRKNIYFESAVSGKKTQWFSQLIKDYFKTYRLSKLNILALISI